jgi:transposase-like protein
MLSGAFSAMVDENVLRFKEEGHYVSPRSLPYLSNNGVAHDLVDSLRWEHGQPHCPRCASKFTKRVNTNIFRELYRCVDCSYMFNSLSGTVFHGSKMPVYKYLHFFVLHNALGEKLALRDVCFALDCSFKTASLWLKRGERIRSAIPFAIVDKKLAHLNASKEATVSDMPPDCETFFSFCEMKAIVVNGPLFVDYIQSVVRDEPGAAGPFRT